MEPVEEMVAKQACADLLARYAWAVNHGDPDAIAAIFTEDAVWERANGDIAHGRDGMRAVFEGIRNASANRVLRHVNGAVLVDVVDADHATFWSQTVEYLHNGSASLPAPLTGPRGVVEYNGSCVRVEGSWYIAGGKATAMLRREDPPG
jgi:uncharacterized protein (TIGR02246 family)